jgi:hypothetical protein
MKLFKSVDEKLLEIGFVKEVDDDYCVSYVRKKYAYTQCLDILHKANGLHIIQSYDRDLIDAKLIGNTCVGLTYYEMKLAMKKMRQKGWKSR